MDKYYYFKYVFLLYSRVKLENLVNQESVDLLGHR